MAVLIDRIQLDDIEGRRVTVSLLLDGAPAGNHSETGALDKRDWKFLSELRDLFEARRTDHDKWSNADEGTYQ